uniref:Uncharacterized protein n=1 Tax=Romanomermis culicivorax TaxID=13658 RepID=A0A915HL97_ROMCU
MTKQKTIGDPVSFKVKIVLKLPANAMHVERKSNMEKLLHLDISCGILKLLPYIVNKCWYIMFEKRFVHIARIFK